jgi:RNA polymerase sigma factor (TIGR02999 family)
MADSEINGVMITAAPHDVTGLLVAWGNGDQAALEELMALVYEELHRLAERRLRRERPDHTLQPSALVNEAYLRLVKQKKVRWQNRAHFFAISAQLMRRILVDHARGHRYAKRGGGALKVSLDEAALAADGPAADVLALDDALKSLATIDPRKSQVVELRFFGGLSVNEAAEVLKVAPNTIIRDWSTAKAWLYREIKNRSRGGDEPSAVAKSR